MTAHTNRTAEQLLPGETFRFNSERPSIWMLVCRQPRGLVKVRERSTGRETAIPARTKVWVGN